MFDDIKNNTNLLPYDGVVTYHPDIFSEERCDKLYSILLLNTPWQHDQVIIFGKKTTTQRQMAWYANNKLTYSYSGISKTGIPFNDAILELKNLAETFCGETFNSCLVNKYKNGMEAMGWHSDNEPELKKNGTIASISLGAERKFCFKHKISGEKISLLLQNGSILLMKGEIQQHWLHSLPKSTKVKSGRINLTFRNIVSK